MSMTPSGGWVPAVVAGETGIGLSQRMQSFVTDARENPFNVVEPGKRPRVTLTPTLALKDGQPWLAFAVQGGDTQDQNLLQFFLRRLEFGFDVQEAAEAPNFTTYQLRSSFGDHASRARPPDARRAHARVGARRARQHGLHARASRRGTRGRSTPSSSTGAHGTMRGGSSNHGEDYGIGW